MAGEPTNSFYEVNIMLKPKLDIKYNVVHK